ncbi:DUF3267 domain-containing protein [Enterococcus alishanensis]
MKLYREVDILNNKKAIILLNIGSILLFFIIGTLFLILTSFISQRQSLSSEISFPMLLFALVLLFLCLVLHEAIHGLFFKMFQPQGKVNFGFKNGMAYATSPGSFYSRKQFFIIAISPFIIVSLLLVVAFALNMLSLFVFLFLATIHGSGCIGDFYYIVLILKAPKGSLIEDTPIGISFYK